MRRRERMHPTLRGFTLIEVVGALVVFSLGVLMVISLTGTLSVQMDRAAVRSELSIRGQERLDSMELLEYDSLTVGASFATTEIRGATFYWFVTISDSTALLRHIRVTLNPVSGTGPFFTGTTFVNRSW